MKILYVATQDDPLDLNAGSGSDYQIYHSFLRNGAEVKIVGPFKDSPSLVERIYRKAHRLFSRRRYAKFSMRFLRQTAAVVNEAVKTYTPDLVFAKNTAPLVYCQPVVPIVYRMDTTLKGSQEQWPLFSRLEYLRMLEWEKTVLRKTSLAITCSQWSADILHGFYHVPKADILIVPNPASLPEDVLPEKLDIPKREMKPFHLLLVGREIKRKGVDIAIRVIQILNEGGIPAELRIVGLSGKDTSNVRYMGSFNKTVETELQGYVKQYQWAHFLIHPARFEAAGIVPGEAAAFGIPTITNTAGGLATTVKHNVSGIVLPANSPPEDYAKVIREYIGDIDAYMTLCKTSRQRFEEELNWKVAGNAIFQALQKLDLRKKKLR
jgi:glycosyltransferase involved in cell wall biosynthesis